MDQHAFQLCLVPGEPPQNRELVDPHINLWQDLKHMKSLSDRVLSVKIIVLWKDSWKQNNHMIWLFNTLEQTEQSFLSLQGKIKWTFKFD